MKKISATALLLIFFGFSAFADFSGTWTGTGTLAGPNSTAASCDEITFEVNQGGLILALKQGYVSCEAYQYTLQPELYVIHGGHLTLGAQTVGTLNDHAIHLDLVDSSGLRSVIDATLSGGNMIYREAVYDYNDKQVWLLDGTLAKK